MHPMPNVPQVDARPRQRARAQKGTAEIRIRVSWCKGCGLCVDYCKSDVLVMEGALPKVVQADRCNRCLQCEAICPDFAIEVREAAGEATGSGEAAGGGREVPEAPAPARPEAARGWTPRGVRE